MDVNLVGREDAPDAVDEGESILLGPEVNVEGVKLIVIYALVSRVVGWQVPFFMGIHIPNHQADHTVVFIRIADMDSIQEAIECILLLRAWSVCDLYARPAIIRIFKQIDV